jgi:hypothetical protein
MTMLFNLRVELPMSDRIRHFVADSPLDRAAPAVRSRSTGKAVSVPANAGTFATIKRRWSNERHRSICGCRSSFRTEAIDNQHPETVAAMRGPLDVRGRNSAGKSCRAFLSVCRNLSLPLTNAPGLFKYDLRGANASIQTVLRDSR